MHDIFTNIKEILTISQFNQFAREQSIKEGNWFCEYIERMVGTPFDSYLFFKRCLVHYYENEGKYTSTHRYDNFLAKTTYGSNGYHTVENIEKCVSILNNHIKYKNINKYIDENKSEDNYFGNYSFVVKFEPNNWGDGVHALSITLHDSHCECQGADCFYYCRCDSNVTQLYYGSLDRFKKQSIENYSYISDVKALQIIRRMCENNNLENILKNTNSKITKKHKSEHVYKFILNTMGCPDTAEKWTAIFKLENQFMFEEHAYTR